MKSRKTGESDAAYIARLESANRSLRERNGQLAASNQLFCDKGRPAASFAGAVLNAAAEATGTNNDPRVVAARESLDGLAGAPWAKSFPVPDTFPDFGGASLLANGGDSEMILLSAFEAVGAHMHPSDVSGLLRGLSKDRAELVWGLISSLYRLATEHLSEQARAATGARKLTPVTVPKIETLEQAREVIYDLWMEIGNTLSDIGMSQAILRLDLRAAMYQSAIMHIGDAINAAERAAHDLPIGRGPFEREGVPF